VVRLEDLIPVTRVSDELEAGSSVYRRGLMGWSVTFTVSRPHAGSVRVKHDDPAFQDSLFDESVSLVDARLDARPVELGGVHDRRTALGALASELRASPVSTLFEIGVKAFIAVIFVIVGFAVLRTFVF
jgi:hypothetical protein